MKSATGFSPPFCHGQVPQHNVRPTLDTWPLSLTERLKTSLWALHRTFPGSLGACGLEDIGKMMMKNGSGMMVHLGTTQTGPRVNPIMQKAMSTIWSCGGPHHYGMMSMVNLVMDIFVKKEVNEKI